MSNARGQHVDTTYLDIPTTAERGIVHRDYLAHVMRWTYVLRHLSATKPSHILDAGCGRDAMLPQTMYTNRHAHHSYLGVDYGRIEPRIQYNGKFQPAFLANTDVVNLTDSEVIKILGQRPDLITSFEVLEHMEPDHSFRFLRHLRKLAQDDATLLLSTPVYKSKVGAADNHVNEWTYDAMYQLLTAVGLKIVRHWGTFASQKDYMPELTEDPAALALWKSLAEYYNTDVLSIMFAPLYPAYSRNVLWRCEVATAPADLEASRHSREWLHLCLTHDKQLGSSQDKDAWQRLVGLLDV